MMDTAVIVIVIFLVAEDVAGAGNIVAAAVTAIVALSVTVVAAATIVVTAPEATELLFGSKQN